MMACSKCRVEKDESGFSRKSKQALSPYCKPCAALAIKSWRKANPGRQKDYSKRWRETNPTEVTPRSHRISAAAYSAMLTKQGGLCANSACGSDGNGRRLVIDHDHSCCPGKTSCGKCIRGLLCGKCNSGIGMLKDSTDIVAGALSYLQPRTFEAGISAGLL